MHYHSMLLKLAVTLSMGLSLAIAYSPVERSESDGKSFKANMDVATLLRMSKRFSNLHTIHQVRRDESSSLLPALAVPQLFPADALVPQTNSLFPQQGPLIPTADTLVPKIPPIPALPTDLQSKPTSSTAPPAATSSTAPPTSTSKPAEPSSTSPSPSSDSDSDSDSEDAEPTPTPDTKETKQSDSDDEEEDEEDEADEEDYDADDVKTRR
ncbi:hypothetical protein BD560DRAFT_420747 [Blakeslea trispora]|nr:hypothetical protein BD560DRAFT_420747 [Blakeslea trispora]